MGDNVICEHGVMKSICGKCKTPKVFKDEDLVLFNGRQVTRSTMWWAVNGTGTFSKNRLYCIHNVQLSQECKQCHGK